MSVKSLQDLSGFSTVSSAACQLLVHMKIPTTHFLFIRFAIFSQHCSLLSCCVVYRPRYVVMISVTVFPDVVQCTGLLCHVVVCQAAVWCTGHFSSLQLALQFSELLCSVLATLSHVVVCSAVVRCKGHVMSAVVCQAVMQCMGDIIVLQLVLQFSELLCSVVPCCVVVC